MLSDMIHNMVEVFLFATMLSTIISVLLGLFYFFCIAPIDFFLDGKLSETLKRFLLKRRATNYLRKLVGRKAYRKFMESEDQVSHAFDYLINIYPEHEEYLKKRKYFDNIQELAKYILEKQKNKKLPKVWV